MAAPANPVVLDSGQVREQVLSAMAQEAHLMLEEGVVAAPMDIDLALITGGGFAFWNGGLTPLLDRLGISEKVNGPVSCPQAWPALGLIRPPARRYWASAPGTAGDAPGRPSLGRIVRVIYGCRHA